MSATETRLPLAEAEALAQELLGRLAWVTIRAEVAGSIRRQRPDVGDIELLVEPVLVEAADLFGGPGAVRNLLDEQVADWLALGMAQHRLDKNGRPACGSKYKRLTYQGVAVDLFARLDPASWGVLLAIRTGPSEFSHRLVTSQRQGGWLPDHLQVQNGAIVHRRDGEIIPTPTEQDVFAVLHRAWIPPEERR